MWRHSAIKTVFILGPMVFAFALAMDVYMPVLPDMKLSLGTTQSMVQMTLSLFLIVTGIGQLFIGPLSDQLGRYKILFVSVLVFLLGSVMCALSSTIEFLIFSRVVQALGCCGMSVVSFAVVRDVFSGKQSSMVYSFINAIIAISPILGPLIGVVLATYFSWQAAFIFLSLLAVMSLLLTIFFVDESLPVERRKPFTMEVFPRYLIVCKSLQFWAYSLTAVSGMSAFFILFSMTPYVIHNLGFPLSKIYQMFGLAGVAYLIGSIFAGVIVNHLGVYKTALIGVCCILVAGIISLLVHLNVGFTLWGFFAPCFVATFGCALTAGAGASGSMEPFFEIAGVASAMFGTIEFALSAVIGSIAMLFPAETNLPIAITMMIVSTFTIFLLLMTDKQKVKEIDEKSF